MKAISVRVSTLTRSFFSEVPVGWGCARYARLPGAVPTASPRRIGMRLGISSHGRARLPPALRVAGPERRGVPAASSRLPTEGACGGACPRRPCAIFAWHGLEPRPPRRVRAASTGPGPPCCGLCAASARAGGRFNVPRGPSLALGGRCTGTFRTLARQGPRPPAIMPVCQRVGTGHLASATQEPWPTTVVSFVSRHAAKIGRPIARICDCRSH